MKTKSGVFVDVTERPGEIALSLRASAPGAETAITALANIVNGLAEQKPASEVVARGFITGHQPGWCISLKPLGAKRVAEGLKPVAGILTVEETRTLRGLLRDARRWAEHPPMLTFVEGGEQLRDEPRQLADDIEKVGASGTALRRTAERVAGRTTLPPIGRLTRSLVTRKSLAELRAAPSAAPETDASAGDPDLRWARPVVRDHGAQHVWEPCASTDDGAVLVVLP